MPDRRPGTGRRAPRWRCCPTDSTNRCAAVSSTVTTIIQRAPGFRRDLVRLNLHSPTDCATHADTSAILPSCRASALGTVPTSLGGPLPERYPEPPMHREPPSAASITPRLKVRLMGWRGSREASPASARADFAERSKALLPTATVLSGTTGHAKSAFGTKRSQVQILSPRHTTRLGQ